MKTAQALRMLKLQLEMNAKVNPGWLKAGYPFLRAAIVEGAEAMEHYGWKWWKQQSTDVPQVRMELVDIWHFMLSHTLIAHDGDVVAATGELTSSVESIYAGDAIYFDGRAYVLAAMTFTDRLELLIGLAVARRTSLLLFETLMGDMAMSWDDMYRQYVAKNVLNFFRQDHGYKQGTYIKIWFGEEDNVVLTRLMDTFEPGDTFMAELYKALLAEYRKVLAA